MIIITTFVYIMLLIVAAFCVGVASVWICEWRMNELYKMMNEEIKALENTRISEAVLHIKSYRIKENYRRKILNIEETQKLILEKMLRMKKCSLKNNSLNQSRTAIFTA